jgi:hypothetical protein
MPTTNLTLQGKVELDTSGADQPLKTMKQQLKEANLELLDMASKFGEASQEAVNAAKKVANLKDSIGDAKALTEAFSPDRKFAAFSTAIQGVAGGFAALQGAQALFGAESKETEKILLKVQSAMALSQGLSAVTESIDGFKNLKTVVMQFSVVQKVVTAAQLLWNAATAANPIGAIVVAVTALIAGITALTSWFISSAKEAKAQAQAVDEQTKSIDKQTKQLERNTSEFDKSQAQQLALAKAQGKSVEAIRALELKLADEKIAYELSSRAVAENTLKKQRNLLETLKAAGADEDLIKKQQENVKSAVEGYNKENANVQKALDNKKAIENKHIVEIEQAKTDARKKTEENEKAANEKAKAKRDELAKQRQADEKTAAALLASIKVSLLGKEQQELANLEKKYNEDKIALKKGGITDFTQVDALYNQQKKAIDKQYRDEEAKAEADYQKQLNDIILQTRLQGITDENEKAVETIKATYVNQMAEIDANEKLTAAQKLALKTALQQQENQALEQLQNEQDIKNLDKKTAELQKLFDDKTTTLAVKKETLDAEQALIDQAYADKTLSEVQYNERNAALTKARIDIGELEKQSKEAQLNGIANALSALSNMAGQQTGVGKALAVASTAISTYTSAQKAYESAFLPVPTVASPALGAVFAGVAVAGGLLNIKKILATKVPNSGGTNPSMPSMSSVTPPMPPTAGSTLMNPTQVNAIGNAAARAYVVESDVTNSQERIERLNRAAKIS